MNQSTDRGANRFQSPEHFIPAYEAALASQDWSRVGPLVHENAHVTFSNGTVHEGKVAVQAAFERNFSLIKSEEYRISNVRWVKRANEMATYVFDYEWQGVINGKRTGGEGRGTCVLVWENAQWRMVAEHLGPSAK